MKNYTAPVMDLGKTALKNQLDSKEVTKKQKKRLKNNILIQMHIVSSSRVLFEYYSVYLLDSMCLCSFVHSLH